MKVINNSPSYYLILEQAFPTSCEILELTKSPSGVPKVVAKAVFQEAEVRNQNKRWYSKEICRYIAERLNNKAKSRSVLMEVDHPMFVSDNPDTLRRRAKIIEYKTSGALLRSLHFDGRYIIGEFETLSGFYGPDIYKLIVYDKVNIGFSLRAIGKLIPDEQNDRIVVSLPLEPITYDIVTNPSHSNARIVELIPESADLTEGVGKVVYESEHVDLLKEDKVLVCDGDKCEYVPFTEDIISDVFKSIIKKIRFKLPKRKGSKRSSAEE